MLQTYQKYKIKKKQNIKIGARYWFWQSMKMKFIASWASGVN